MFGFNINNMIDKDNVVVSDIVDSVVVPSPADTDADADAQSSIHENDNNESTEGTLVLMGSHAPATLGDESGTFASAKVNLVDDDVSLHTTCSDASIDLEVFLAVASKTMEEKEEVGNNLSFHVSEMDSSDLKEGMLGLDVTPIGEENQREEPTQSVTSSTIDNQTTTPDFDAMISVSQQLLQATPQESEVDNEEGEVKTKTSSLLVRYKIWVLVAIALGAAARGMNHWWLTSSSSSSSSPVTNINTTATEPPILTKIVIREGETNLMVGDYTFRKETLNVTSDTWSFFDVGKAIMFGMIAKLVLASSSKTSAAPGGENTNDGNHNANDPENTVVEITDINHHDDNASEDGSDASSVVNDQQPDDTSSSSEKNCTDSVPSLIPIQKREDEQEEEGAVFTSYDLSKYQDLKVTELRAVLRSRKCSYAGRKVHLIHRLVSVYHAELQSLTVVQLRKKLKSRNMKRGGLKRELVQTLVEAGL